MCTALPAAHTLLCRSSAPRLRLTSISFLGSRSTHTPSWYTTLGSLLWLELPALKCQGRRFVHGRGGVFRHGGLQPLNYQS
jgi:hypothetical protein